MCSSVCRAVDAGIKQVTSDMECVSAAQHSFTFTCGCKGDHPGNLEMLDDEPFCLTCGRTGEQYDLPSGYELWQIQKINNADSEIAHSVEIHSHSKNSVNGGGGMCYNNS